MITDMSSNENEHHGRAIDQNDTIRPSTSIQKSTGPTTSVRRGRRRSSNSTLPCPTCGELYSRRDNLRVHQRVHSGEKPFKCEYCGARFRWVGVLRTHEATHRRRGEIIQNQGVSTISSPNSSNSTTLLPQHRQNRHLPPTPQSQFHSQNSNQLNTMHFPITSSHIRQPHPRHAASSIPPHSNSFSQHHHSSAQRHSTASSNHQPSSQDISITINMLLSDENEDYSDNRRQR